MTANSQRTSNGTKKGSTARKTSTAKKTNGRKPQTKNKRQTSRKQSYNKPGAILRDEIILWAILAVSVIILISNFNLGGSLGQKISSLFLVCLVLWHISFHLFYFLQQHSSFLTNKIQPHGEKRQLYTHF